MKAPGITVIAFDVFGTVFNFSGVPKHEIRRYVDFVIYRSEPWTPLKLPKTWEQIPAHPDSKEGIERLRQNFIVVTCSNGPLGLLAKMSKNAGISWDAIIPLELSRVYKPKPESYLTVCNVLDVEPSQVMLVTANPDFGDLEGAAAVGMKSQTIRHPETPKTIIELAEQLERERI